MGSGMARSITLVGAAGEGGCCKGRGCTRAAEALAGVDVVPIGICRPAAGGSCAERVIIAGCDWVASACPDNGLQEHIDFIRGPSVHADHGAV